MRYSTALLISSVIIGTSGLARADSFGGMLYSSPSGYTTERFDDHVKLTKLGNGSFCSIAIFEMRQLASSAAIETAYEWHNVVTPTFTAKVTQRAKMETAQGAEVGMTRATLATATGSRYVGIHYVVLPPGMIGSVLLLSSSTAALRGCERVAAGVIRSLDVDWDSPRFTDPEARVDSPQGRWAISGTTSREYTFQANGRYRFHSETTSGDRDRVVDEAGTYLVRGNQLVVTPRAATSATISSRGTRRTSVPLEQTTYTWTKRYVPATNEWRFVLVPRKPTARDGDLPPEGYSYSDRVLPRWKFGPAEPAI